MFLLFLVCRGIPACLLRMARVSSELYSRGSVPFHLCKVFRLLLLLPCGMRGGTHGGKDRRMSNEN